LPKSFTNTAVLLLFVFTTKGWSSVVPKKLVPAVVPEFPNKFQLDELLASVLIQRPVVTFVCLIIKSPSSVAVQVVFQ